MSAPTKDQLIAQFVAAFIICPDTSRNASADDLAACAERFADAVIARRPKVELPAGWTVERSPFPPGVWVASKGPLAGDITKHGNGTITADLVVGAHASCAELRAVLDHLEAMP